MPLTQEQQACMGIITELMDKKHHMRLKNYYAKPKKLCLNRVHEKMAHTYKHACEYTSIADFASDLREMAVKGYMTLPGPSSEHAAKGQLIEKILDQKVAMLGAAMREQGSLATTIASWATRKKPPLELGDAAPSSGRGRRRAPPAPLIKLCEIQWAKEEKQRKKQREIDQKKSNAKLSVDIERFEQRWLAEEVGVVQRYWEVPAMGVVFHLLQGAFKLENLSLTALEIGPPCPPPFPSCVHSVH